MSKPNKTSLQGQIKAVPKKRRDLIEETIKQVIAKHGEVLKKLAYE